ncbi:hypothetical protein, partial [Acidithiobacillus caldus]|uniref:hypothetical protein n=1 Tax=Acidithiobacillus caldus TaxID=33059 RepID=UPI001C06F434
MRVNSIRRRPQSKHKRRVRPFPEPFLGILDGKIFALSGENILDRTTASITKLNGQRVLRLLGTHRKTGRTPALHGLLPGMQRGFQHLREARLTPKNTTDWHGEALSGS